MPEDARKTDLPSPREIVSFGVDGSRASGYKHDRQAVQWTYVIRGLRRLPHTGTP